MIPWLLLDTARIPGGGELRLKRRGAEFSIMLGDNELMNCRLERLRGGARDALLREDWRAPGAAHPDRRARHGLHLARGAWRVLDPKARVVVAELVPAVVAWARGPMADVFGASLTDPRVKIVEADVGRV